MASSSLRFLPQQQPQFFQPTPPYSPSEYPFPSPDSPADGYVAQQWPAPSSWPVAGASSSPSSPSGTPKTEKPSRSPSLGSMPSPSRYVEIKPKPADPAAPTPVVQRERQRSPKHESMDDSASPTTDFVKKLFKILEEQLFPGIVAWNARGDCFIIIDVGEFSKAILPRMFKHSNFASFVRQLNKYDFHKVKNTDDAQYGEQSWTFRHRDFHRGGRDALDNIRRKTPCHRGASRHSPSPSGGPSPLLAMQTQLERMAAQQEAMTAHIRSLETEYETVLGEMVSFQKTLAQQDELMRNMVQVCFQFDDPNSGMGGPAGMPLGGGPMGQQMQL